MINAWVAEGERWVLEGEDEPAIKFRGAALELHLNWLDRLTFSDGDAYSWKKARACPHPRTCARMCPHAFPPISTTQIST